MNLYRQMTLKIKCSSEGDCCVLHQSEQDWPVKAQFESMRSNIHMIHLWAQSILSEQIDESMICKIGFVFPIHQIQFFPRYGCNGMKKKTCGRLLHTLYSIGSVHLESNRKSPGKFGIFLKLRPHRYYPTPRRTSRHSRQSLAFGRQWEYKHNKFAELDWCWPLAGCGTLLNLLYKKRRDIWYCIFLRLKDVLKYLTHSSSRINGLYPSGLKIISSPLFKSIRLLLIELLLLPKAARNLVQFVGA